jgi:WD40 repeat protein
MDRLASPSVLQSHAHAVVSLVFNHSGTEFASGGGFEDPRIIVRYFSDNSTKWIGSRHTSGILDMCYNKDDSLLISGSVDTLACVWDAQTGDCLHVLSFHSNYVFAVLFSHDESFIYTGSSDRSIGMWDTRTWERKMEKAVNFVVFSLSISPRVDDEDYLPHIACASSDTDIVLFDGEDLSDVLHRHIIHLFSCVFVSFIPTLNSYAI